MTSEEQETAIDLLEHARAVLPIIAHKAKNPIVAQGLADKIDAFLGQLSQPELPTFDDEEDPFA